MPDRWWSGPITETLTAILLRDTHHRGELGQAQEIADELATFVDAASTSLDIAIYDFRLSDPGLSKTVADALTSAADRGVAVRIAYDAGKPAAADATTFAALQADPAPIGTGDWLHEHFDGTGVVIKPISAGGQLMHCKYVVRDAALARHAAVWTGSTNFTDDAWTRQENNIIKVVSHPTAV